MARPTPRCYTWSDREARTLRGRSSRRDAGELPQSLEGKELRLWVVYSDNQRQKRKKKARSGKPQREDRRLWAVLIVEAINRTDPFTFEADLRTILKWGERMIKVWVKNDPQDQSEDAAVFGFVSPSPDELTPLERQLTHLAAGRIYEAISHTWPAPASAG